MSHFSSIDYGHRAYDDGKADPSRNDMPLQFSARSGPKVIERSFEEESREPHPTVSRRTLLNKSPGASTSEEEMHQMWGPGQGGQGGMPYDGGPGGHGPMGMPGPGMMGPMGPMYPDGPMAGPMMGGPMMGGQMMSGPMGGPMMGAPMMGGPMGPDMGMGNMQMDDQKRPVLHFTGFTLFPPSIHQGAPPVGERPPGCRTIFVGGQPEKMTAEMMTELFTKHGGEIINIRQGKRTFCHIRFSEESAVDQAMAVSGYRVRIGANIDPESNGRLRVDYAQNRDDLYEFECDQRRRAREARHHSRDDFSREAEREENSKITPRFSSLEGTSLLAKLKAGESFPQAANLLITWLERGECDKKTANQFYHMFQVAHVHVKRLIGEKATCDLQLSQMQQNYRMQVIGLITQYTLIEQVLMSASKQKAWDHFTRTQRKNIHGWKKQTKDLRQQQEAEMGLGEKGEAEMELSDEEGDEATAAKRIKSEQSVLAPPSAPPPLQPAPPPSQPYTPTPTPTPRGEDDQLQLQVKALMHQNGVLRSQMEALKAAAKEKEAEEEPIAPPGTTPVSTATTTLATTTPSEEMETQIKALQHSLLSMQQQLQDTKNKWKKEESLRRDVEEKLKTVETQRSAHGGGDAKAIGDTESDRSTVADGILSGALSDKNAQMIGLLSIFLNVHPFGASTEYLWSYMQRVIPSVRMGDIETLMNSHPTLFRQDLFGVGATLEKRWRYIAFAKFEDQKS